MKNKKTWIALGVMVLLMAVAVGVFYFTRVAPEQGWKWITVEIVHSTGETKTVKIWTDAEYLSQALLEKDLIVGYEDQYGFVVQAVDGEEADWNKGVYWAIYVNGETAMYGASQIPLKNGDSFKLAYETF